jgi:uncharacterized tellurite resistance protein B-like protein/ribosomal protein L32|tara:strand:- start:191 stop:826 length:636 start_codon:yes stop_codon:yes gene_type:complete
MFDFLNLSSEEDKLITYLGLMRWLMTVDDEFHEQERAYLQNFVSHLDDKKRTELSMKVKNINLPELIERVKKFNDKDQLDLINKLIEISAVDGNINGKEAYVISFLANSLNMNVDVILNHMVKEFNFNKQLLDQEIARMNDQYSTSNQNTNSTTNKHYKKKDTSKVIGYRRHSVINKKQENNQSDSSSCPKCGKKHLGSKFCTNCGNKLIL